MTATPDNTEATAVDLGTLAHVDDIVTATGNNTTGTSAWYSVAVPSSTFLSLIRVTVTGSTGDEASLFWSVDGRTLAGPSTDLTEASLNGAFILYVQVTGGTSGDDFTMTASVLVGPPQPALAAAVPIGTLTVGGDALTATDSNAYGESKWYSIAVPEGLSPVEFALTGSVYDSLTVFSGGTTAGTTTDGNFGISAGTAYVAVAGGTADDSFTLTVTPPS